MKYLFVLLLVGLMVSCGDDENIQPMCDEVEGLQVTNESLVSYWSKNSTLVSADYTGVVKRCISVGEDEKVQLLMNFKNGKQNGLQKQWYENAQLWEEENYKDGVLDGLHRKWHRNGKLAEEGNYKDGNRYGLHKQWYSDGQLWEEQNYKNDERDGLQKEWHHNGQLEREEDFKEGYGISFKCWDEDGNQIECW